MGLFQDTLVENWTLSKKASRWGIVLPHHKVKWRTDKDAVLFMSLFRCCNMQCDTYIHFIEYQHYSKQILHCYLTTQIIWEIVGALWKADWHISMLFGEVLDRQAFWYSSGSSSRLLITIPPIPKIWRLGAVNLNASAWVKTTPPWKHLSFEDLTEK